MDPETLVVEYGSLEDFLGDCAENLAEGATFIHTRQTYDLDTPLRLAISFPGLRKPIVGDAVVRWVRDDVDPGIGVELVDKAARARLASIVAQIRDRDPRVVARVVKVLVVEDNAHLAGLVCTGLSAAARRLEDIDVMFAFDTAADGGDALKKLEADTYDCMIVDVYLPVTDGTTVIATARKQSARRMPIISMSGGGDGARKLALTAGASTYLEKPVRLRQMLDTMRTLVKI